MPTPGRHPSLARDKAPPPLEVGYGLLGARGSTERPGSLRETIVRWLNEEL